MRSLLGRKEKTWSSTSVGRLEISVILAVALMEIELPLFPILFNMFPILVGFPKF